MTTRYVQSLRFAAAVSGLLFTANAAIAHDVWLTLTGEAPNRRVVINYGHPGDRPPPLADKILDLVAIKSDETTSLLDGLFPKEEHGTFVVQSQQFSDDGHVLLAARYDNGYWVKLPSGLYRNATRRLAPDAVESLWSSKFAKAVTGAGSPWQAVTGHDLEIIPLSDPAEIRPGENLKVRVHFHGQPIPKGEVERGDGITAVPEKDIPRFVSDKDGVATIPILKPGPHLLVIDHRVTPSSDQANFDLYAATLWFSVSADERH
jgi:nickel transport protein